MNTRFSHAAAFGAATGIAAIAFSLLVYAGGLHEAFNYLTWLIVITGLCIGLKKWREQSGGFITFGGAYGYLMLVSTVYVLIMAVWVYIFAVYVAPGFIESQITKVEMQLEEQGQSQEAIEMGMKMTRWMMQPGVLSLFALLGIFGHAVANLIIAAIMKKDPPTEHFNQYPHVHDPNIPFPNLQNQQYGNNPNPPYGNNPSQQQGNSPFQPPSNFPPQQ
jgi:hypothetical protein